MRAINVFPDVVLREGPNSSMLEFGTVLLAAKHQGGPCYIFFMFLKNVALTCVLERNFYPIYLHFHNKRDIKFVLEV